MRLGIFGGTFDPVHYGHLLLAEQCREQVALDAVWLLPAAVPPHKRDQGITAGQHRLAMLELATAGHPALRPCALELQRGGTSFTVDTLRVLAAEDPQRELFLLLGADMVADLPYWREPRAILQLATVVAVNRGRGGPDLKALANALGAETAQRVVVATMPGIELSATDLRRRAAEGRSLRYMTPRAVEEYIREHRLYSTGRSE